MSILPYLAITQVAAVAALLTRRDRLLSLAIGLLGLVGATWAALLIVPGASTIGGEPIVIGPYARLFLALGSGAGALLAIVGYATSWQRNVPAAMLAALGWTGLALVLPDTGSALTATVVAGLAGVLVTLVPPAGDRGVRVSARELRAVAIAGAIALAAVAWVDVETATGVDRPTGPIVGLALLSVTVALGLRFGAVPFHAWAGRLSQAAPVTALPLLLAWAPAGFALVALGWMTTTIAPFAAPSGTGGPSPVDLGVERMLIVVVALLTLVGGAFAAWIQDEVEHVVGYLIAQDAGFILLAFAAGTDVWGSARTFILAFAIAMTALAAWALALTATFRTNKLDDLDGWARRSPGLLAGLIAVVVATVGWPGSAAWSARWSIATGIAGDGLGLLILLAAFLSLTSYVRIARIGLHPPGTLVSAAVSSRIRWPGRDDRAGGGMTGADAGMTGAADGDGRVGLSGQPAAGTQDLAGAPAALTLAVGSGGGAGRVAAQVAGRVADMVAGRVAEGASSLRPLWRSNRLPTATALALVLAALALATAGGAFGLVAAAREPAPPRPAIVLASTPEPSATSEALPQPSASSLASTPPPASIAPSSSPPPPSASASAPTSPSPGTSASAGPSGAASASVSASASASPSGSHHTYAVKSGDNLYAIAQRLGTTVATLLDLNPALKKDPTKLVVGQVIAVP